MTTFEYEQTDISRLEGICVESRNMNSPDKNTLNVSLSEMTPTQELIVSKFKMGDFKKEEAELLLSLIHSHSIFLKPNQTAKI